MRELRPYQVDLINSIKDTVRNGIRRMVVALPVGAGKTLVAANIASGALAKGNGVAFTCPRIDLIDQTVEEFGKEGISDIGVIQADHIMTDYSKMLQVCSLQTMERRGYFPNSKIVIFDEVHLVRGGMIKFMDQHPEAIFIGLSATPWTKGLADHFETLIVGATMKDLMAQGYLSKYRAFAPNIPNLKGVKIIAGDYQESQLSERLREDKGLTADIVKTWQSHPVRDRTLVFAVDRAHAKLLQARFQDTGIQVGYQDAFTPAMERRELKRAFQNRELPIIVSVETMIIGNDMDVRCISCCRPTQSEMLWCLDPKTEILTSNGWKGVGEVKKGDCVAAMDNLSTGSGRWSGVTGVIERYMEPNEKWVSYEGQRGNFRVTDNHRMIYKSAKKYDWNYISALKLSEYKAGVFIPTAVTIDQPGIPLSDPELYFIGMMMTDGSWGPIRGTISQSERHPYILERIEKCLKDCGIGYSKRKIPDPKPNEIAQRFPRWEYRFSAGKPKAYKVGEDNVLIKSKYPWEPVGGTSGFRHLLPWLDKDFASSLMALSKRQFKVLIQGINDGDGFKLKSPSVDWTPRSWVMCSARKLFVDRLQALASIHGLVSNVRKEQHGRKNPIYIITISHDKDFICIGANYDGRPTIQVSDATKEKVWCVETEHGTIITRRNGKVTVMGNCQLIGRGMRLAAPGSDSKESLLLLDHSANIFRLGRPEDIEYETLLKSEDEKPNRIVQEKEEFAKACPKCSFMKPPKTKVCPSCGFEAQFVSDIMEKDGVLEEITRDGVLIAPKKKSKQELWGIEQKKVFMAELKALALEKGRKVGWACNSYKQKFGERPERSIESVPPAENVGTYTRSYCKSLDIRWFNSQEYRDRQNAKTITKGTSRKVVGSSLPTSVEGGKDT